MVSSLPIWFLAYLLFSVVVLKKYCSLQTLLPLCMLSCTVLSVLCTQTMFRRPRYNQVCVCVQEIQSLLINWKGPDLTTYGELVLEGTFQVQRAKNTRMLFLFDKMLLITKKRGEHYVYKTHILVMSKK